MSANLVQHAIASTLGTGSAALAYGSNVTAGNLLVVGFTCFGSGTPTISDTLGNTWTALTPQVYQGTNDVAAVFYCVSSSSGANTVTVTLSGSSLDSISILEFSGANTFDVSAVANTGTAGLAADSGGATTTKAIELLVGIIAAAGAGTTFTAGTGWTAIDGNATSLTQKVITEWQTVSATGTYDATATLTSGKSGSPNWVAWILTFYYAVTGTATDTESFSDSPARAAAHPRSLTDTSSFSEALVRSAALTRALTFAGAFSDSPARLTAAARALADTEAYSDTVQRGLGRQVVDTVSFSDALTRTLVLGRGLTETLSFSEALARLSAHARALTDGLAFSDSVAANKGVTRGVTDSLAFSDSLARVLALAVRQAADTLAFTDAVQRGLGRQVADAVAYSDSPARQAAHGRTPTDTEAFSETLARATATGRTLTDTLVLADSVVRLAAHSRAVADTASTSDSVGRLVAHIRALADTEAYSDGAKNPLGTPVGYAVDRFVLSEVITRVVTAVRQAGDFLQELDGVNLSYKDQARFWELAQAVQKESALHDLAVAEAWEATQAIVTTVNNWIASQPTQSSAGAASTWQSGQPVNSNQSAASAWQAAQPVVPRREQD